MKQAWTLAWCLTMGAACAQVHPGYAEYAEGRTVWMGDYSPDRNIRWKVVVVPNIHGMAYLHAFVRDTVVFRDSFEISTGKQEWFFEDYDFDGYTDLGIAREHAQNVDIQPFMWNPSRKGLEKAPFTIGSFKLDSARKVFIQSGRTGGPGMRIISYNKWSMGGLKPLARCEGYYGNPKAGSFRLKFESGDRKIDKPMTGDPNDVYELCDEAFDEVFPAKRK
jgi:hypothetical protein